MPVRIANVAPTAPNRAGLAAFAEVDFTETMFEKLMCAALFPEGF